MMAPRDDSQESGNDQSSPDQPPTLFGGWPMFPSRHIFAPPRESSQSGGNERPMMGPDMMTSPTGGESDQDYADQRARVDPFLNMLQTMLDIMHRGGPMAPSQPDGPSSFFKDLAKEPTSESERKQPTLEAGDQQPDKKAVAAPEFNRPMNETKEEIVEIEGKKYLRKTIINRHVGENLIFMTKRLIFVPLNETETETTTTTSTAKPVELPSSTTSVATEAAPEATTTTTTSAPSTEAEAVSTTLPPSSTATESAKEETTTKKESLMEEMSDAINKAAERLVEKAKDIAGSGSTTTTAEPTTTSQ